MRLANADRIEQLREESSSLRSQANTIDAYFARKMKLAQSQLQSQMLAKESDLKQLQADQARALDQLQAQHHLDVERTRAEARQALAALEDEIVQMVALQEQSRRASEAEIAALRVAKPHGPDADQIGGSPRRTPRGPDSDQINKSPRRKPAQTPPTVDLTVFRQAVSDAEVEAATAVAELEARRTERDLKIKAAVAQFREAQSQFQTERLDLEQEVEKIKDRLREVPTTLETIEPSPREVELLKKIALQRNAILHMRDEVERYQVEVPKRKPLLALQAKRREAIAELQESLENVRSDQLTRLNDVINELSEELREQRLRQADVIADIAGKLEGALEQRRRLFRDIEEVAIASAQKWRELRNDISTSTISLCTRSVHTPMAFTPRVSEPALPSLTKP
jgi:DNA repair exonuclease SbcCD ATPase subunit